MTECAAPEDPCWAKRAEQMVCKMKKRSMPATEAKNSTRRPMRSLIKDASTAQNRFQICKIPLMRSYNSACEQMPCITGIIALAYLNRRIGNADSVEHSAEVVGDETVPGPLREEGNGDDDAHTASVACLHEERLVTNVGGNCQSISVQKFRR